MVREHHAEEDSVVDLAGGTAESRNQLYFGIESTPDVGIRPIASETYIPSDYILFYVSGGVEAEEAGAEGEAADAAAARSGLYAYAYANGTLTALSVEAEEAWKAADAFELRGHRLAMLAFEPFERDSPAELALFDVADKTFVYRETMTVERLGADEIRSARLRDGRVYLLAAKAGVPQVVVLDAEDGTVLYRGEVKPEDAGEAGEDALSRLTLNNMSLAGG